MNWLTFALIAACAAAATAILAKIGVQDISSNLATAIRTSVILVIIWMLVLARGEATALRAVTARTLIFLVLSGIATGVSWLAYFKALQLAPASRVAPIDKLSLPLTIALAALFLSEPLSWRLALGVILMTTGALLTL